jgi:hypothetical protein
MKNEVGWLKEMWVRQGQRQPGESEVKGLVADYLREKLLAGEAQELQLDENVPGIPYHTIVGDRGRGDTPNSSDGVVPYWSSHLDGATSELVVPSHHSAHQNPQAIVEVRRILLLNARR